jgi:hypothetical protein
MRLALGLLQVLLIISVAVPSQALKRYKKPPFLGRTVISAYAGASEPLDEFGRRSTFVDQHGSSTGGNHDTPGYHGMLEIEHYFSPNVSLGFSYNQGRYDDMDLRDTLQTHTASYGGFLRFAAATGGSIHPFVKVGLSSMRVEFDSPDEFVRSTYSAAFDAGAGFMLMVGRHLSLNGTLTYTYGWTRDALIHTQFADEPVAVGFDVSYWGAMAGLSLFFP